MEKSHHAAKAASQAHTQHGGTKDQTSIIVQQYQHWYRNIQHRYARRIAQQASSSAVISAEATRVAGEAQRRRLAWSASRAAPTLREWRKGRVRQGRRWVPIDEIDICQNDMHSGDTINTTSAAVMGDHSAAQWIDEVGPSRTVESEGSIEESDEATPSITVDYQGSTEDNDETEYGEDHVTDIS